MSLSCHTMSSFFSISHCNCVYFCKHNISKASLQMCILKLQTKATRPKFLTPLCPSFQSKRRCLCLSAAALWRRSETLPAALSDCLNVTENSLSTQRAIARRDGQKIERVHSGAAVVLRAWLTVCLATVARVGLKRMRAKK